MISAYLILQKRRWIYTNKRKTNKKKSQSVEERLPKVKNFTGTSIHELKRPHLKTPPLDFFDEMKNVRGGVLVRELRYFCLFFSSEKIGSISGHVILLGEIHLFNFRFRKHLNPDIFCFCWLSTSTKGTLFSF